MSYPQAQDCTIAEIRAEKCINSTGASQNAHASVERRVTFFIRTRKVHDVVRTVTNYASGGHERLGAPGALTDIVASCADYETAQALLRASSIQEQNRNESVEKDRLR